MKAVLTRNVLAGVALCVLAALSGCKSTASAGGAPERKTLSDETSAEKRASIRLQLAVGYFQGGNYEVALDEVKKAIEANPDYADAYGVRALIYNGMGELALAEDNFQRAMRLAPRNPELNNNFGSFLCQHGRYAEGLAQFELALKNPQYQSPEKAMINAGGCSIKMKNLEAAERYLLDALRIEPDQANVHASLARVYFERRDYARAGFFINRLKAVAKLDTLPADVLWLALRVERKLGDKGAAESMATQLRRRHPGSPEFAALQRGAFDE